MQINAKKTYFCRLYIKTKPIYEQQHEIIPTLKGIPLLQALLEESNLQPKDLISILQSESIVLDILNGKRQLTANQIQDLAVFFSN